MIYMLMQYSPLELMLMVGTVVVMAFLLAEVFDFKILGKCDISLTCNKQQPCAIVYGYDDEDGPATWKMRFSDSNGCMQSPINISSQDAIVCTGQTSLKWCMYSAMPSQVVLWNDGHSVILQPSFCNMRPNITGGPLTETFDLVALRFRWGANDYEGSEHTIDCVRYAMELQAIHIRQVMNAPCSDEMSMMACPGTTMILSYVFQVTDVENPYLEDVINGLRCVRQAGSKIFLQPFPLSWLLPQFSADYYMYLGSLTNPPCTEGVKWIVQPEPLAVSCQQVRQFRRILNDCGSPLLSNCRPIQNINNRDVFYYCE